jgi:RimJ/RimL family protein N-acetyltransferase
MPLTPEPIASERLLLEPLRVEPAAEMVALLAAPAMYEYTGGEPPSEADLRARYRRQSSRPGWLNWVLRLRDSGQAVGTVQATQRDERTAELAWVVGSRFQGAGYASEGVAAAIGWLRGRELDSFIAHIHPNHAASGAVAGRLGFRRTDAMRDGEARWELASRCHN